MRRRNRLSFKLTILVTFLGVFPLFLLSLFLYRERKSNVKEMVAEHLGTMTAEIGTEVERTIFSAFAHIRTLAENPILKSEENSLDEKLYEMEKIQKFFNLFEDITLLNLKGVVLASTAYDYRGNWEYKDWFIQAKNGRTVVSPVHVITFPIRQVVVVTAPITDSDGRPTYVIAGQVNMERIWEITDRIRFRNSGFLFLIDNVGNLLAFPDKVRILYKLQPEKLSETLLANETGSLEFQDEDGTEKLCIFSLMTGHEDYPGQGWRIGVLQDSADAFFLLGAIRIQFILFVSFGLAVLLSLLILLQRNIVRPLQTLVGVTQEVSHGNLESRIDFKSSDEIADLGHAFNRMVADLKSSRDNLVTEKERLSVTLRSVGEGVIALDTQGRIILVNKVAENLTGWTSAAATGNRANEVMRLSKDFLAADVTGEGEAIEIPPCTLTSRTGTTRIVNGNVNPVFSDNGDIVGAVIAFRDITEKQKLEEELIDDISRRKKVEKELQKSREELEEQVAVRTEALSVANRRLMELDQLKTMFIASMSHELRTPLNAILGFSGVLLQGLAGELSEEQRRQLSMISESGKHLLSLINDIIDVSKIESGKMHPDIRSFDGASLLREIIDTLAVAVRKKGLVLSLEIPDELPMRSDITRVRQVLTNLIINAVKFTEQGSIEVNGEVHDGNCVISVRDTGSGIRREDMANLFRPFSQLNSDANSSKEGTGLGLYLSRNLARLLGGELSVVSEYGVGSEFTFTLPMICPPQSGS